LNGEETSVMHHDSDEAHSPFCSISEAIEEIRQGRMVIVLDDEDRENEGDLTMAAEKVTPEAINFMAKHGRGLVCTPITEERALELGLPLMVERARNDSPHGTAFTVSVDARGRVTTGISAADRAATIEALIDPDVGPEDLMRPGHTFPLIAAPGGVLRRTGQTEASVDLARLAGLVPAGVICEVMNEDGTMARRPQLEAISSELGIKMITVADLVRYRLERERLVRLVASPKLPTRVGDFQLYAYESLLDEKIHMALVMGEIKSDEPVLVRVHSECLTGEVFGSLRCDCGEQLQKAMHMIAEEGKGVIIYLRQEGRGIGLLEKLRAYELQERGQDTVEANQALGYPPDKRDYGLGAQILKELGIGRLRYLTNNPHKFVAIRGYGLEIVERVPLEIESEDPETLRYLKAKKEKLGHLISSV
jgi:3,4-dihydroxy 2-butanone 4-phosphate synthase/GTP cyclohydrolase II